MEVCVCGNSYLFDGYFCSQSFVRTGGEGGLFWRNSLTLDFITLSTDKKRKVECFSLSFSLTSPSLSVSQPTFCLSPPKAADRKWKVQSAEVGGSFVIVWERVEWTILLCCPGGWGLLGDLKQVIISSDEKGWQWLSLNKCNEWKHYFRNPHFVYSGSVKS